MPLYECRGCGSVVSSNGKPDKCYACGGPRRNGNDWHRIDDVDELLS